jgi:gliding motility-associated transport system ATP-binding protein
VKPAPPVAIIENAGRVLAGREIVKGITLEIRRGEVLGLLGVNGAGKSTTLRMLAGLLAPTTGSIRFDGEDLYENPGLARRRIGYLPEVPPLHDELTVEEFLLFCGRLHGLGKTTREAVEKVFRRCDLLGVRRQLIGTLSKGFRQRVGLAQAIVHEPDLVVLDEPAAGLDPVQARSMRYLVKDLAADHAVVLSTHVLPEVLESCRRVAILGEGRLRYANDVASDSEGVVARVRTVKPMKGDDWPALGIPAGATPLGEDPRYWRVMLPTGQDIAALPDALVRHGFGVEEVRREESALEAIFMSIAAGEPSPVQA